VDGEFVAPAVILELAQSRQPIIVSLPLPIDDESGYSTAGLLRAIAAGISLPIPRAFALSEGCRLVTRLLSHLRLPPTVLDSMVEPVPKPAFRDQPPIVRSRGQVRVIVDEHRLRL
jgi:hypothetical protein